MPIAGFLKLKGQTQGYFMGSVTAAGREGRIAVLGVIHSETLPFDSAGRISGKKASKPFVIVKDVDQASPLLHNALANNEPITEFTLDFWRPTPAGAQELYYTVNLTNATIASLVTTYTTFDDPSHPATYREEISFLYQKIQWTWVNGGIYSSEGW